MLAVNFKPLLARSTSRLKTRAVEAVVKYNLRIRNLIRLKFNPCCSRL